MGSTDEPNRFQHTRVLGVDDVVANTGEGGVAAMGRTAGWGCCGGEMVKEEFVTESSPLFGGLAIRQFAYFELAP
jgi:hypothetical protein